MPRLKYLWLVFSFVHSLNRSQMHVVIVAAFSIFNVRYSRLKEAIGALHAAGGFRTVMGPIPT